MNLAKFYILIFAILIGSIKTSFSMVFDNRYFPLFLKPYIKNSDMFGEASAKMGPYMHYQIQPFFMRAEKAHGFAETVKIPDIDGEYNMRTVFDGLIEIHPKDRHILKSNLQNIDLPWSRNGRVNAQGMAFYYEQFLHKYFSVGTSFLFLHYSSYHEFKLPKDGNDFLYRHQEAIFSAKDKIHRKLNLEPAVHSKIGFGDIDLFVKGNYTWKYIWKFRTIDTRLKLGTYIPTSNRIDINNPASLSIGGNKHWGIYVDWTLNTELKEDWWASVMFRGIKRFKKTFIDRIPTIDGVPSRYGALINPVEIDPGWSLVFNPYVTFAGLRDGFGLQVLYTLVHHWEDQVRSPYRTINHMLDIGLKNIEQRSAWRSEYVTASAFYDFGLSTGKYWMPRIALYWDIPVSWLEAKQSYKTNAVSIMIEGNF